MISTGNWLTFVLSGGILVGALLCLETPRENTVPRDGASATSVHDIAGVYGAQEPIEVVTAWERKCCAGDGPCTPNFPAVLPALANCWAKQAYTPDGLFRAGCAGSWSCTVNQGQPANNQKCVAPPPGAIVVPRCALEDADCVDYKMGACVANFALYCVCDADGEPTETAKGRKLCKAGSNTCVGIVPVVVSPTGN